jgi:hypothetical protein
LTFAACRPLKRSQIRKIISDFGGIGLIEQLSDRIFDDVRWVDRHWEELKPFLRVLKRQRRRSPIERDFHEERSVSKILRNGNTVIPTKLAGIGPKQSRNILQSLGLMRYEIPLDSRLAEWMNANLTIKVDVKKLSQEAYYNRIIDQVRALCSECDVLPCVFDAAVFKYMEKDGTKAQKIACEQSCGGRANDSHD